MRENLVGCRIDFCAPPAGMTIFIALTTGEKQILFFMILKKFYQKIKDFHFFNTSRTRLKKVMSQNHKFDLTTTKRFAKKTCFSS